MSPPERAGLDREEVVRVALELLDEVGLDGLTMRSLGERLGVKAASLYWHLRDKDELAELLLEAINAEIRDPDPALPWRAQVEQLAWEWRRVLLAHRDTARLAMGRLVARPVTLRRIEFVVASLRKAGFNDQDAADAAYLFSNFIPGFVAEETMVRPAQSDRAAMPPDAGAAPVERARLDVGSAKRLTISADPSLAELYRVGGDGRPPEIRATDGVVNLTQTHGRKPSTLMLNGTIPWDIHIRRGAAQLTADLRGLQLTGFEVAGGSSSLELTVPLPSGTVPIRLTGGTSKVALHRPGEVPIRLRMRGGISHLTFDGKKFGSAHELTVQSPAYDRVADRYDVVLTGGVSKIVVDTQAPALARPDIRAADRAPQSFAELSASEYPNLVAVSSQFAQQSMDDRFRFGLKVLLDGLDQRLRPESSQGAGQES
jgi:AcrR family transcriptional regulator